MTKDDSISIEDLDTPVERPFIDAASETLIEQAVASLVLLRFPASLEDAAAELHGLASLIAQANACLPGVVARALDQDYGWREIACCLDSTPEDARRRYGSAGGEPPLER